MLDDDTDAIMHARYIADQVRLGKRTLSTKERSALAMGFDACDRQRAAHARAAMALRLSPEDREALEFARKVCGASETLFVNRGHDPLIAGHMERSRAATAILSKLLAASETK